MNVNKTSTSINETQLSSDEGSLTFISQFKDPCLKMSMAWNVFMNTDAQNVSSRENYNDSYGLETADDLQVLEKEKVPAFYRNSMNDVRKQKKQKYL